MSYFTYVLKSDYDETFYYGCTKDLTERLKITIQAKADIQKEDDHGNCIISKLLKPGVMR